MAQHLIFKAGQQSFGLPITETDKIIALENYTPIPDVSSYIVGVQEIDGEVYAMIDLADRFYSEAHPQPETADVIMVNWKETRIGLLVDEVQSVQAYQTEDLMEADEEKVDGLSTSYISAFIQSADGVIPILDSHRLFAEDKAEEMRKLVDIQKVKV
ncbi:Positive regulator of CheA protein activity (CheW) [Alkalibacterium sp. AK22]|uniref:chemotaxis protein CheW n=1 Tax=Alkalibacterium sp. AK22 TaxID=1229520 RepID=UPI0004467EED|nr:chemotaxis protein CheW [Alkalibacterium sp. AK22]EXJ22359.1 Positive regulator of CheA protein activity (CheW) [Alkalibacterium sp. AK22]